MAVTGACSDRCEALCVDIADAIDRCRTDAVHWGDLGARGQGDYRRQCRGDWDRATTELTSRELELALDVCELSADDLATLSCDEVMALYGPL